MMDPPVSVGLVTTRDRSVSPPTEVLLDRCADASVAFEWHPSAYYVVALLTASGAVYAPSPSKPVRVSFDVVHARTSAGSPPPGGPYALTSLAQSKVWHGKYFYFSAVRFRAPGTYHIRFSAASKHFADLAPKECEVSVRLSASAAVAPEDDARTVSDRPPKKRRTEEAAPKKRTTKPAPAAARATARTAPAAAPPIATADIEHAPSESFEGRTVRKEFKGFGVFSGLVGPLAQLEVHGVPLTWGAPNHLAAPTRIAALSDLSVRIAGYLVTYEDGDKETLTHAEVQGLLRARSQTERSQPPPRPSRPPDPRYSPRHAGLGFDPAALEASMPDATPDLMMRFLH